jgi:hypothetical protein
MRHGGAEIGWGGFPLQGKWTMLASGTQLCAGWGGLMRVALQSV